MTTEPYYQDDSVTLYHGDCLEITEWLAADVLVTDPPYGMAYESGRNPISRPVSGDHDAVARDSALRLWGERPAAVFGTWKVERPFATRNVIIWDKSDGVGPGMGDLGAAFGNSHEEIYILSSWPKVTARRPSVIRTSVAMGNPSGLVARTGHPTPKPVGLMEVLIKSAPSGVVADPFAGSGATLVAARNLGRHAIGVELEERYCELVAKRLDQMCLDFGAGA